MLIPLSVNEAAKDLIVTAIELAREEAGREEARLGRKLTQAEAEQIADVVERQLRTAIATVR